MNAIHVNNSDNVGTALTTLNKGDKALGVVIKENVSKGHKFATEDILKGQPDVYKRQVHDLDLTTNLTELGLTKKDIPWLVDNVYVVATGNIANTVADVSREDIEMLYKKMF